MKQVIFNTSNELKLLNAMAVCEQYGISISQSTYDPDEIQSEDPEAVSIDKAKKVFELAKQPVVITDDSWSITGLNGFPGVYMHSMNVWFKPEDFLRLTEPLEDRTIILTQYLVYMSEAGPKVFKHDSKGKVLRESRGSSKYPSHTITALDEDNGLSIAETYNQEVDQSKRESAIVWHEFARWYSEQ